MNTINDFPWNKPEILREQYKKNNHKITYTGSKSRKALVFFSSNGIYYPNNEEEFSKKILTIDYYDWLNIGKHRIIKKYFSKIIYLRDIYKQWYITGINNTINTQDKLYDFLCRELEGYDITTCGSSSGGYMAALMGSLLNAERIIDSSGQFDLTKTLGNEPFLDLSSKDPDLNRYFSIKETISSHTDNLYYFYPAYHENDIRQNEYVKELNIKRFAMNSNKHSKTIRPICYPYVLTAPKILLDELQIKHKGSIIDDTTLYKEIVPVLNRIIDPTLYNITRILTRAIKYLPISSK
ncbi:MAG: hypothetical protein K6E98_01170 [Lachnospiraceae bacterium]|nr:hypothetical protein [Lachnospiraceae bacterium]